MLFFPPTAPRGLGTALLRPSRRRAPLLPGSMASRMRHTGVRRYRCASSRRRLRPCMRASRTTASPATPTTPS
eukprot:1217315-Alexandrium_andersonii.AAC.1